MSTIVLKKGRHREIQAFAVAEGTETQPHGVLIIKLASTANETDPRIAGCSSYGAAVVLVTEHKEPRCRVEMWAACVSVDWVTI